MLLRWMMIVLMAAVLCGCGGFKGKKAPRSTFEDEEQLYDDVRFDSDISKYGSLAKAEEELVKFLKDKYHGNESRRPYYEELIDFLLDNPETLSYPFALLEEECYINIVTSEDGNLRLYSWDSTMGGTWIAWTDVCQYRSDGRVYAVEGSILDVKYGVFGVEDDMDNECVVLGIETLYDKSNNPIYIAHTNVRYSSNWVYASVEAVGIHNGKLKPVPVFYGQEDIYDDEEYDHYYRDAEYTTYDWFFRANDGEGWDWLFYYDKTTQILYVPQAAPEITDRYDLYRFTGDKFFHIGVDGGSWLHPSVRSFEFLERLFDTKDYRIRIDKMFDGSYRYASWNNRGSMDKEPNLIIYNGSYDEEGGKYIFDNDGYKYIIEGANTWDEIELKIRHNGRTILSQKMYNSEL